MNDLNLMPVELIEPTPERVQILVQANESLALGLQEKEQENARLREQLKAAQAGGWVSVEERLPEEERLVLITSGQRCRVAKWNHKTGDWRIEGNFYWPVRFWRELPPLPGEE